MPAKKAAEAASASGRTLVDDFLDAFRSYPDKVRVTTASNTTPVLVTHVWRHSTHDELRLLIGTQGSQDEIGLNEITGFTTASP